MLFWISLKHFYITDLVNYGGIVFTCSVCVFEALKFRSGFGLKHIVLVEIPKHENPEVDHRTPTLQIPEFVFGISLLVF